MSTMEQEVNENLIEEKALAGIAKGFLRKAFKVVSSADSFTKREFLGSYSNLDEERLCSRVAQHIQQGRESEKALADSDYIAAADSLARRGKSVFLTSLFEKCLPKGSSAEKVAQAFDHYGAENFSDLICPRT